MKEAGTLVVDGQMNFAEFYSVYNNGAPLPKDYVSKYGIDVNKGSSSNEIIKDL